MKSLVLPTATNWFIRARTLDSKEKSHSQSVNVCLHVTFDTQHDRSRQACSVKLWDARAFSIRLLNHELMRSGRPLQRNRSKMHLNCASCVSSQIHEKKKFPEKKTCQRCKVVRFFLCAFEIWLKFNLSIWALSNHIIWWSNTQERTMVFLSTF